MLPHDEQALRGAMCLLTAPWFYCAGCDEEVDRELCSWTDFLPYCVSCSMAEQFGVDERRWEDGETAAKKCQREAEEWCQASERYSRWLKSLR